MKIIIIIILLLSVVVAVAQAYISKNMADTEQHIYQVLKVYDKFEVRHYDSALFSSVKLEKKAYEKNSSEGFRILAGYIFGDNASKQKIAMTTPVAMELGDTTKMRFMVPKAYKMENLPSPTSGNILFEKQPERTVAAIRFDGWANDEKIEKYKLILIDELAKAKISHTNAFTFLGYNPPFEVVNRRNEVVVELIDYK